MVKAVIIDDDPSFIKLFSKAVKDVSEKMKMKLNISAVMEPIQILKLEKIYDIYFLAIIMHDMSGIDLACKLRTKGIKSEFVFVSGFEQDIRHALKVKPVAYIRKSSLYSDLHEALIELEKIFVGRGPAITLKNNLKDVQVFAENITTINSHEHYLYINYQDGKKVMIRNSMKNVQEQLRSYGFVRVNRRCIVNVNFVESLNGNKILMKDKAQIAITDSYKEGVQLVFSSIHDSDGKDKF